MKRSSRLRKDFTISSHCWRSITYSQRRPSKEVAGLAEGMQVIALSQPVEAKPKTYFMVPVRWNDDFVGRTEILAALESKLCKGNYCRVALVGLGGMGQVNC